MQEWIESRQDVMKGKPCLSGTRIPVYVIARKLAEGETEAEIMAAFPQLRAEHIRAVGEHEAAAG